MISLVAALQSYKDTRDLMSFWHKTVDNFIYSQGYDITHYRDLCYELQTIWPNSYATARQDFLIDVIVKHVPFTEDTVFYAMCATPNHTKIMNNTPVFVPSTVDSTMPFKYIDNIEFPAVAFFNSMDQVRQYYRDVVRIGEIVFFVMSCYFSVFKTLDILSLQKFKRLSINYRIQRSNPYSNLSCSNWKPLLAAKDSILSVDQKNLPDGSISIILLDCLAHFAPSGEFIGRCY